MALFGKGEEKALADFVLSLWEQLTNEQVWVWRDSSNPYHNIFDFNGYVDNTPLYELLLGIVKDFGNVAKRTVITTANDVITGRQMEYIIKPGTDDIQTPEWRASVVKASASVPFVFPPTNMHDFGQDVLLMDGGTTWNNNMVAAINECLSNPYIKMHQ